jgi:hypothetical protein
VNTEAASEGQGSWPGRLAAGRMGVMRVLKAHVRGGRLLLDEPTDLPEGSEPRVALIEDGEPRKVNEEKPAPRRRQPGTGRGLFTMGPDFDDPLPEFDGSP